MFSTYREEDVTILLKDITGLVEPLGTKEREKRIQSGTHYCEMLPIEYEPTADYIRLYDQALALYAQLTADAVASVAEQIWAQKGPAATLVSLARAGTSIGVLIRRYLRWKYGADVAHYTISIIRGRGIDDNAMRHILQRHSPESIQFIDGWIGKGAIGRELEAAMKAYPGVSPGLAVLSDPAGLAEKTGTPEDFLIASSCLNATVSGLMSRTFLRGDIIGPEDFHGSAFYAELRAQDRTYEFIETVQRHFRRDVKLTAEAPSAPGDGLAEAEEIARAFHVGDVNLVKPGIGETTRVLLRRVPWKVLVRSLDDWEHLAHIYQLAKERGVELVEYPLRRYRACGLIQTMADQ